LFAEAKEGLSEGARDQTSAGLQFKPQRRPLEVIEDQIYVMHHAFDPAGYFSRCASVALRLNTIANLIPGWKLLFRNLRTFARLCWTMSKASLKRGPFWRSLMRVVVKNPAGLEAFATLSVLYLHFESMMPYVYGELEKQRSAILDAGEADWLAMKIGGAPRNALPSSPAKHALNVVAG
jgi:hypothetical protein